MSAAEQNYGLPHIMIMPLCARIGCLPVGSIKAFVRQEVILEFSYNQLKQMDVIGVADGKHLGKVCDIVFTFPEGRVCGFYVTGGKGFRLTRPDFFIPLGSVVRIGEDVIITNADCAPPPKDKCKPPRRGQESCRPAEFNGDVAPRDRRSYDEYE